MAYTARKLITKSWYLSGIVSRGFSTPTGAQISEGLELLNSLLAIKTANNKLIPYFTRYTFDFEIQEESYFIENLISIETITFNNQTVRFPLLQMGRKEYFNMSRVNDVASLPYSVHAEREKGGMRLYFYFLPDSNYPVELFGKFSLNNVTLDQDLSLTIDLFYIEYLRYALASYICQDSARTFPAESKKLLEDYEQMITFISPPDLSTQKISTLQDMSGINWAYVNFPGWTPS